MKTLSIEKMENLSGGCSFEQAMFYSIQSSNNFGKYLETGDEYYLAQSIAYSFLLHSCI
ncbi:hypothetical protein [Cecembia rubra]|uniref:hypothetical protein n=1 Tax=Cecembia rubra TaxID=1485585 RepID=UPI0027146C84|nr:hypothetical protein [Cecembia rubra]